MSDAPKNPFVERLQEAHIEFTLDGQRLAPATVIDVQPAVWSAVARIAKGLNLRWSAFWCNESAVGYEVFSVLFGEGGYLVVTTHISRDQTIPSLATIFPSADRPERHAHDLLGVRFENQPDSRRWVRHQAWMDDQFPLHSDWQELQGLASVDPDEGYPFVQASGSGVYEIPVGPVHAGIIEPGHFRFQAVGETVLNLEQHLGYVHKGIEKIAIGRDPAELARLAGRVSGDSTVAHTWAACMAMEQALRVEVPTRANLIRGILCERERVANHLGDIGAICNDVGFSFAPSQLGRLREEWLRENRALFGHRLLMDCVIPGGVAVDLDADGANSLFQHSERIQAETAELIEILERSESLEDRLMTTGRLTPEMAWDLGAVGYVGRASGVDFDVRRDAAYCPYHLLEVTVPGYRAGDVAARAKVRADEITVSLGLIRRMIELLEPGEICAGLPKERGGEGLGVVDGWRGETLSYVALDASGRVARFYPRDPSWLTWPALEQLIQGNIVPDFPVCNKSVNGSYSGQDL